MPQMTSKPLNIYEEGELEKIAKIAETNDRMEDFFGQKRDGWNKNVLDITTQARCKYNAENAQTIVDLQATALAYRQNLNDEISMFLQKRIKEKNKLKKAAHEKTIWYALGKSPLGLNYKMVSTSHMSNIIDSHVSEVERGVELIDSHIDFLRTSAKILADIGYQVKNTIEFYNLLTKN